MTVCQVDLSSFWTSLWVSVGLKNSLLSGQSCSKKSVSKQCHEPNLKTLHTRANKQATEWYIPFLCPFLYPCFKYSGRNFGVKKPHPLGIFDVNKKESQICITAFVGVPFLDPPEITESMGLGLTESTF